MTDLTDIMCKVAPPGQNVLTSCTLEELRHLTQELREARPEADSEHARFLALPQRSIPVPDLRGWLWGKTVLVTGGTGCIGTALMNLLAGWPHRLASVSRGVTDSKPHAEAEYFHADIRNYQALAAVFDEVRPDIVFHVAAQRNPGLAETEVARTVTTNVFGTSNVIRAAENYGVEQVVFASTGKAVRPYSPEIYTASKRIAEWLAARAAPRILCSSGRFTHVADNSIVYDRLRDWAQAGVMRLHAPDIMFYGQSALESAQLLLNAGLYTHENVLTVHAITDLGFPIDLLNLALGTLNHYRSQTPVYFSGYDPGYESKPFPALYDPMTAGDVSPLLNAFETATAEQYPATDGFPMRYRPSIEAGEALFALREACMGGYDDLIRGRLDTLSWCVLDDMLAAAAPATLGRVARLADPFEPGLCSAYNKMLTAIRAHI